MVRQNINQRLFDAHGIDTNINLKIKTVCPRPFDTLLFDRNGQAFACECQSWLPMPVGNIQIQTVDQILDSNKLADIKGTIQDGSYKYCNNHQCTYIKWKKFDTNKLVSHIRLAVDESCNLSCPSCRTQPIFIGKGPALRRKQKWIDKIIDWILKQEHHVKVHIGSDGDPFASLVYRYFMKKMSELKLQNVSFAFQTNGLLLKKMYHRTKYIFDNLYTLNISIDGATQPTYEKLRRGGSFKKIIENFEFIKTIKNFPVYLHTVVQKDNWREMPAMIDLAEKYGFEKVYFTQIGDWNTGIDMEEQRRMFALPEYQLMASEVDKNKISRLF